MTPLVVLADTVKNEDISAAKNMEKIEEQLRNNDLKFENLLEELRKKYTDFDWNNFDNMSPAAKRIIIKNYLVQKGYSEIVDNYKKDFYRRSNNDVTTEEREYVTEYFNSSDLKYIKNYIYDDIMKEAEQKGLLHKTEGAQWKHFKQKDVPALDKLISKHMAKAPVDIHCEKDCAMPYNQVDENWHTEYLKQIQEHIDKYEQINKELLQSRIESLQESKVLLQKHKEDVSAYKKKYHNDTENIKWLEDHIKSEEEDIKSQEKALKEQQKKLTEELLKQKREYDQEVSYTIDIAWRLKPYRESCEMVTLACFNDELIPLDHESLSMSISKADGDTHHLSYSYDDIKNNKHIDVMTYKTCHCNDNNNDWTSVDCNCSLGFLGMTTDFTKYRNYINQNKIDNKNYKNQDYTDDGKTKHEWLSDFVPIGTVSNGSLAIYGSSNK